MARAENLMFFKKSPAILIDQIWQDYLKLPVVFKEPLINSIFCIC